MAGTSNAWHGIPRETIKWAPAIDESLCPQRAIGFPPVSYIAHLIKENRVLVEAKRRLEEMHDAMESGTPS